MKSKFNIWLNIVTMCICICAITIGIYSLKQANLTVSGSIGFVSSKLKYDVTAQMKGYMTKDSAGTETYHPDFEDLPVTSATNGNKSIALGEIYFTNEGENDTIEDIVIELEITNNESYPLEATLGLPGSDILTNVDFTKSQNVVAQMGTTTANGKIQKMTINMSLANQSSFDTALTFNFSITLNKFEQIQYDKNIGYYTTMGSHIVGSGTSQEVKAVKWLPIARYNAEYTETNLYNYEPYSNTTEPTSGSYYFISENILDLGLDTENKQYQYGVSYNNTYFYEHYYYYNTKYSTLAACNYLASNIRALLKGDTRYDYYVYDSDNSQCIESGQQVNLLNEYGIQGYTYSSIILRNAEELCDSGDASYSYIAQNYPALVGYDELWLLSSPEIDAYYTSKDKKIATTFQCAEAGWWWTRTGVIGDGPYIADCITTKGYRSDEGVSNAYGVRPAFALTI